MGVWVSSKDVVIQSTTSPLFQYFLIEELKTDISLTSPALTDDFIINVSADHGFVIGDVFTIFENNIFEQSIVKGVSTNAITISIPFANDFSIENSVIIKGNRNLNVNAVTPKNYICKIRNSIIPVDISQVKLNLQSTGVPDDGKFGGIDELDSGIYFRQVNGRRINLGNYINNLSFRNTGWDVIYTDKAPAGEYSTNLSMDLSKVFNQVLRLNPREDEYFSAKIRDDLSDLNLFYISIIGSFTEGE